MFAFSYVGQLTHNPSSMSSSRWILDYGVSHCIYPNSSCFATLSLSSSIPVMVADGTLMPLEGFGYVVTLNLSLSFLSYSEARIESFFCC